MTTVLAMAAVMNLAACGGVKTGRLLGLDGGIFDALFEIDLDTGEGTVLHFFDVNPSGGGMVVGPDGTLYAAFSGAIDELVIVAPETGEVSFVGPFGFSAVSGLAFGSDGTLYGFDNISKQLITIDPLTGEGTAVGFVVTSGTGLAFTPDGTLYLVGSPGGVPGLYTVDPGTGKGTLVGTFGSDFTSTEGLTVIGDVLYASGHRCDPPSFDVLVTLDRETGEATQIGPYCSGGCKDGPYMNGLAFLPGPGDVDRDGDVDLDDFSIFQLCFTGPLEIEEPLPVECQVLDTDKDNDLDLRDFAVFQAGFTGPNDIDD
ncbi:MAG: hypothetical protein IH988_04725 [Planctomycetes bacterium]|nr:hypothetical protein [Planctomycetota bacterium]